MYRLRGTRVHDVGLGELDYNVVGRNECVTTPGENRKISIWWSASAGGRKTNGGKSFSDAALTAETSGEPAMGDRRLRDAMMVFGCPFSFFPCIHGRRFTRSVRSRPYEYCYYYYYAFGNVSYFPYDPTDRENRRRRFEDSIPTGIRRTRLNLPPMKKTAKPHEFFDSIPKVVQRLLVFRYVHRIFHGEFVSGNVRRWSRNSLNRIP